METLGFSARPPAAEVCLIENSAIMVLYSEPDSCARKVLQ